MNKTTRVLQHLIKYGEINSWDAILSYGVTSLSDIIYNLRKTYNIETVNEKGVDQFGHHFTYAKYVFKGEIDDSQLNEKEKSMKIKRAKALMTSRSNERRTLL